MVSDNNITAKKMVPDNNSFEELRHVVDEPGIVIISISSNGTMTIETEKGNSDVFMKSTMSGTCSEKEFVTYPKSTSNATSRKL